MIPLEFTTTQRKVNDLIPLSINPRKISEAKRMKMIESIQKFNLVDLPVVDADNTVISGHQRLRALQAIGRGDELIDVRMPNRKMTDKEVKEYNLLANTHFGEFDFEALEADFADIDFTSIGFDMPTFNMPDLSAFGNPDATGTPNNALYTGGESIDDNTPAPPQYQAQEDDFEAPEDDTQIQTDIVLGDLIEFKHPDGRYHRLLCGDSTKKENVERLMDGEKDFLLLTDPPYGIGYAGSMKLGQVKHGWKQYEGGWDECKPNKSIFDYLISRSKEQIIWGGNYFTDSLPPTMGWLIWDKGQRDFSLADGEMAWTSFNNALRIKTYSRAAANKEERNHPTQKPVEIISWCVSYAKRHSKVEFKNIIDTYLGSGTTMVTSHQLNLNCYGMEFDEKYCQVIVNRMRKLDPDLIITKNGIEL
jgi:site-specific DNA-methyltransferase (adenine-specific)